MKKRFLSILLGLCVALSLLPMVALATEGETANEPSAQSTDDPQIALESDTATVNYVDADGNSQSQANYTVVTGSDTNITWNASWYVVNSNVTITGTVTLNGDVHLILCDGCTLTVSDGVGGSGHSLTIYGQSAGTGKLAVAAPDNSTSNAIVLRSLTVNGGTVTATAGDAESTSGNAVSYGIYLEDGDLTATGSSVTGTAGTATSDGGNAVSYGIYLSKGDLIATGSTVTGTAGDATSNSSNVDALYARSYGIRLGNGDLTVTDSSVTGTGGTATSDNRNARSYGIHLGDGDLTATGSTVTGTAGSAESTNSSARSRGIYLEDGDLTATGSSVTGTGGTATSIYSSAYSYGIYLEDSGLTATDSTVTGIGGTTESTYSSARSYGIKANKLIVNSGNVTGVGGSAESTDGVFCKGAINGCTIAFMKDESASYATVVIANGSTVAKPATPNAPDGCNCFAGWYEKKNGEFKGAAFNFANTAITENITLYAKWETHTGGTATCKEKAVCTTCGEQYGELDSSNHAGGTATCTKKAVCDYCGESYGEVDADNHTVFKHIEAKAATTEAEGNIEYWCCEACGKYFSDKEGKTEITLADTVVAKLVKTNDGDEIPQTGDNSHVALLFALLFASGGALLGTSLYGKRRGIL